MRARVYVTLKPGVHDPAGKAVQGGLVSMGYEEVRGVRIGKFFEMELADDAKDPKARVKSLSSRRRSRTSRLLSLPRSWKTTKP